MSLNTLDLKEFTLLKPLDLEELTWLPENDGQKVTVFHSISLRSDQFDGTNFLQIALVENSWECSGIRLLTSSTSFIETTVLNIQPNLRNELETILEEEVEPFGWKTVDVPDVTARLLEPMYILRDLKTKTLDSFKNSVQIYSN